MTGLPVGPRPGPTSSTAPTIPSRHGDLIEALGGDIASGAVPPGTVLGTDAIAGSAGVSRTVAREAIRVLESMRMVDVRRRSGVTVRPAAEWNPYDHRVLRWRLAGPRRSEQLRSLAELLDVVEPTAADLAARLASPDDCGTLTGAVLSLAAADDAASFRRHRATFHRTVLIASGNSLFGWLAIVIDEVLTASLPDRALVERYRSAATAIQAGDGPTAARSLTGLRTA